MFRVRLPDGRMAWIAPEFVQAVMPHPENLTNCIVFLQDGARVIADGVADDVGAFLARAKAGLVPIADLNEPQA